VYTVSNIEDDRAIKQTRERIFEGIHRVQSLVGETRRLILNPSAEPPAIAAPAVLAEPEPPEAELADGAR
jgi:hypothetical protein